MSARSRFTWTMLLLSGALALTASVALAAEWPHWRGPSRSGHTTESSRYVEGQPWAAGEPLWRANVGIGASSPVIGGGRLFVLGWSDDQEHVTALDAATGEVAWKQSYASPLRSRYATGDERQYSGPTGTPEYDAETGYLYTLGLDGNLNCWDARRAGEKVWGCNLFEKYEVRQRPQFGPQPRDYGYTTAPLVLGEALLVEVGAEAGAVIAYHKRTGAELWKSKATGFAGHSGGIQPMTVEGAPCAVVFRLEGLLVLRTDRGHEGETVAELAWRTSFNQNIGTPAVVGDSIVLIGYWNNANTVRLRVSLDGGIDEVWRARLGAQVCSATVVGDRVYLADRGLTSLDFANGEIKWDGGRFGKSTTLIATSDGRLIAWTNAGDLALIESAERSPDSLLELSRRTLIGGRDFAWPHVALAEGRLYCKSAGGEILCLAL